MCADAHTAAQDLVPRGQSRVLAHRQLLQCKLELPACASCFNMFWACARPLTRSASTTSSCPRTALQSRRDASCSRQCLSRTSLPSTSRNSSFVNDIDIISSVAIAGCERRLQPFQHHPNAANTSPPASSSGTQHMNMVHSPSRSIGQQGLADQHSFIDATKLDMKTHASNSAMVAIGRRMSLAPLHTGGQSLL